MRTIEGNRISEYLFFNKFYFIALMLLKAGSYCYYVCRVGHYRTNRH